MMLEETPWLRQAEAESQARRNVGILFDDNRLNDETARLLRKLAEHAAAATARWPWFPGGPANDYITLYITTGFGRLRHLGVEIDIGPGRQVARRGWTPGSTDIYREILKHGDKDENHLSPTIAFYLYGRSFFLEDQAGRRRSTRRRSTTSWARPGSTGWSWPTASRRPIWPWR